MKGMSKQKKIAVIDGYGKDAEVSLYLEDEDGEVIKDLPWLNDWPSWVSTGFLRKQGYEVISA